MDVRDLRYVHVLAEHGNVSRAADALGLTQPALTRRVQALERELKVRLFDRHPKGVSLTPFGRLLVDRAAGLLQGVQNVRLEIDQMRGLDVGEVNVGAGPVVAQIVGDAVGRLLHKHPRLRITVIVDNVNELTNALRSGRTDMFVGNVAMAAAEKDLEIVSSFEHAGYFFCRPGHPILERRDPSLEEIFAYPFASAHLPADIARRFETALKRPVAPAVECDSYPVLKNVVAASDAISLASRYAIIDELRSGKLVEVPSTAPAVVASFGVVRLMKRLASPAATALAGELAESASDVLRWAADAATRPVSARVMRARRAPRRSTNR
jgi:DNA-binding transcriptional LysR family regulator